MENILQNLFDKSLNLLQNKEYKQCKTILLSILQKIPQHELKNNSFLLNNLGMCELKTDNIVESIKKITKVNNIKVLEGTPCDQSGIYADSNKLKKILDLNPQVKLENGLRIFHNWAKELRYTE